MSWNQRCPSRPGVRFSSRSLFPPRAAATVLSRRAVPRRWRLPIHRLGAGALRMASMSPILFLQPLPPSLEFLRCWAPRPAGRRLCALSDAGEIAIRMARRRDGHRHLQIVGRPAPIHGRRRSACRALSAVGVIGRLGRPARACARGGRAARESQQISAIENRLPRSPWCACAREHAGVAARGASRRACDSARRASMSYGGRRELFATSVQSACSDPPPIPVRRASFGHDFFTRHHVPVAAPRRADVARACARLFVALQGFEQAFLVGCSLPCFDGVVARVRHAPMRARCVAQLA